MPSLQYSSDALDTLPLFHRKPYVIYVEGPDDIPFWDVVLKKTGLRGYVIKPAGGEPELRKYIDSVLEDDSAIAIASDAHYARVAGNLIDHPRVIYTYGHSIENMMYSPIAIAAIIATSSRVAETHQAEVDEWLSETCDSLKALLIRDIANEMFDVGIRVLGDNSAPYLEDADAIAFGSAKIEESIARADAVLTSEMINTVTEALGSVGIACRHLIRGHFLTHLVWNYVKLQVANKAKRRPRISQDALYALTIAQLEARCEDYEEWDHLVMQVERLKAA